MTDDTIFRTRYTIALNQEEDAKTTNNPKARQGT